MTEEEKTIAWHFLPEDRKLRYNDGRLVVVGETLSVVGKPVLCKHGQHASAGLVDAIGYAPGPVLCRVEVWGDTQSDDDKIVSQHRRVIEMHDVTKELHLFACAMATFALEGELSAGRDVDERRYAAVQAKQAWVRGEISDADLAAAGEAAGEAAWAAAREAAREAAWAAAGEAAWAAAGEEAWAAAGEAAWAAAEDFALRIIGERFASFDRGQ